MKVVNLFAGPGVGKSTTGSVLYGMLSMAGFAAEYVPEFAKFASWAKHEAALSDQVYMFSKQENRLHVLKNHQLDYVIMDGPLPVATLFTPDSYYRHFEPLVMEVFADYQNVNFFLERNEALPYRNLGRNENEASARELCLKLEALLDRYAVQRDYLKVGADTAGLIFTKLTGLPPPLA